MKIYKRAMLPKAFKANGIACGIKKSGKPDLALFYSALPAKAACLFTANKIQAAPIQISKQHLKVNKEYRAIIANSGSANCFTGRAGLNDARQTAEALARALGIASNGILVASTGVIGKRLPLIKIQKGIPGLIAGLSANGISKAKRAILTTDTFTKEITLKFNIMGATVTICGVAKGAGMIAPNMATMLAFILSDADITQRALNKALKLGVDNSFNCITVDGCMSTNDAVVVLANGSAGNTMIDIGKGFNLFASALNIVCLELAKLIVKDAEGATKFIEIKVSGAPNFKAARKAALFIANSNLFKTALYGESQNFGRIIAAIGASGIDVKEENIKIKVSPLNKKYIKVHASVGGGGGSATVYTADLTPQYIKINAQYN